MKKEFIKAIENVGVKNYRLVYKEKGKYGKPEAWVYPIEKGTHGYLLEIETIENLDFLKEYLNDLID